MIQKEKKNEEQNEYAENVKGETIYILDAESGKKGYFCIGCKAEMQAVKSKIRGRKSYFRHDATDVKKNERECTFSNQDYRHTQAISILNRIKRIKVPPLYKFPPKNSDGEIFKIKNSEFIDAKYTKSELTFYETDDGDVKFGKNPEINNRNLLIRPDVTFFNEHNEPVLLIEIVVTHKIDSEKLAKIKRLRINTVQVTIPKNSLENIERSFSLGKNIKWIHNNEQERTEYIFTTNKYSEELSQIDEFQKKLFQESFECRNSEVRNLIRAIKKCMESQHYREIENDFRREIFRVENNTRKAEDELEEYRDGIREKIEKRFESRRSSIKTKREELDRMEYNNEQLYRTGEKNINRDFNESKSREQEKDRELEERYLKRRRELEIEQKKIRESILEIEFFESTETEYRSKERKIDFDIEQIRTKIKRKLEHRNSIPNSFKQKERDVEKQGDKLTSVFNKKGGELESSFDQIRETRIKQIENEDYGEPSEFSIELKKILDTRSLLIDWDEKQLNYERYRKALEHFRKGTYKNWNDHK
ncbi:hypothetical protein F7642_12315 [Tenacibaculum finnmarkense genomovar ulcerans]|uniref:hypothetical protein n=1 Tax=Tenacibaculum finnmarkense TaxID=2781243 RepID=UPI00187BABA6|nr:hypothetical protein [Tenacibaculum finnmarkense]MBE7635108.1 hypothetical protein [Tenacibaculum finnmarkense genomovar ulcerans]MCD8431054.1 hypothetical protein [Tenacibaculum finnmarkense genomovar ulcerans]